jgi:glycosyltransferase involved in cell wall biosynthesis
MASGYLAYTERGRMVLSEMDGAPKRVVVLRNTVDTELETRFREAVAFEPVEGMCAELGTRTASTRLLYFGRLIPSKRVDLLIDYARRCHEGRRAVDVIIFGRGSEASSLREQAAALPNVVFHQHDDLKLARALRISAAVVIPGFVGLAVTHGFIHGVPILTRRGEFHSPEVEYIEDGKNGLMLPAERRGFFEALDRFVDDPSVQLSLAQGAAHTAQSLDMSYMVSRFQGCVAECLEHSA